jgi:hypothetical protein
LLLGATRECDRGRPKGRKSRKQASTQKELWQYKKFGIWVYYRKAEFQIKSALLHDTERAVHIQRQELEKKQ